ncbi:MAG: lysine--tRNA ligase [Candidatus Nanoarchaeia archaeon]
MSQDNNEQFENVHWADNSAQRVLEQFPNEDIYTVASGITPSGYIHIGNFREVITTEFVRRALVDKGVKTKFLYSWDSYDAFRKVPKDVPQEWEKYLRMPDGAVPNPFDTPEKSYAEFFMKTFESEVGAFNFPIEFQNQYEIQQSGVYADSIREMLNNKHIIIEELNKYRGEDQQLNESWWPIDVYDDETQKDTNEVLSFDGKYTLTYKIREEGDLNGAEKQVNFKENPRVKLRWKADWPMRWNYFKVCFEPGGKDHSTPGSSYTVGREIIKRIFNRDAPVYTMYDFVLLKGVGGKISSSKGGALRVRDVLDIYTPEMVLFIFAGTRPNAEIHLSFDQDVIKLYEDFDKLERLYFGLEEEKNEKQRVNKLRQYELSLPNGVGVPTSLPLQPQFRHLSVLAQSFNFDYQKVEAYYKSEIKTEYDKRRLKERFECVKNWIRKYAPAEFTFEIKSTLGEITNEEMSVVEYLREALEHSNTIEDIVPYFKSVKERLGMDMKVFFTYAYYVLIGKKKGPKLSSFLLDNKNTFLKLLNSSYTINDEKYSLNNTTVLQHSDFSSLQLKTGLVIGVQSHPQADNLMIVRVRVSRDGEAEDVRQIVFGADNNYSKEELINKKIVVLTNVKHTKFKGVESQGMIIAGYDDLKNTFGIVFSQLAVGECLKIKYSSGEEEVAQSSEEIKKEFFLQVALRGVDGKMYYNDILIEGVVIDRNISGKII